MSLENSLSDSFPSGTNFESELPRCDRHVHNAEADGAGSLACMLGDAREVASVLAGMGHEGIKAAFQANLAVLYKFAKAAVESPDEFQHLNRLPDGQPQVKAPKAGTDNAEFYHALKFALDGGHGEEGRFKPATIQRYARAFRYAADKGMTVAEFLAALARQGLGRGDGKGDGLADLYARRNAGEFRRRKAAKARQKKAGPPTILDDMPVLTTIRMQDHFKVISDLVPLVGRLTADGKTVEIVADLPVPEKSVMKAAQRVAREWWSRQLVREIV